MHFFFLLSHQKHTKTPITCNGFGKFLDSIPKSYLGVEISSRHEFGFFWGLGFFVVSLEERGMRAKDECGVGGRWWYQGEGGESVMGRGEKRRRRRQLASGERNRRQLGKKRNGREGRFKN